MKELSEILNLVTSEFKNNPGRLQALIGSQGDQKLARFFNHITNSEVTTDEEAMKLLYGNIPLTGKYRMLKARAKEKMIDMIFLGDNSRALKTPYNRSLYQAQRNILVAQLLILKGKRQPAISLLKSALKAALYYQHTALAVAACRLLCYDAAYNGNSEALDYYETIYADKLRILLKEIELENLYNYIMAKVTLSADYDSNTREIINKNFTKASVIYKKYLSHHIRLYYHRIAIRY